MLGANELPLREVDGFAVNFNRANRRGMRLRRFEARSARRVFSDAHVVGKNGLTLFRAYRRETLRGFCRGVGAERRYAPNLHSRNSFPASISIKGNPNGALRRLGFGAFSARLLLLRVWKAFYPAFSSRRAARSSSSSMSSFISYIIARATAPYTSSASENACSSSLSPISKGRSVG